MAPPVSPALRLPVALHRLRVGLPVLPLIIGMASAPFLLAIPADLVVHGVGFNLATVIIPPMAPLTVWCSHKRSVEDENGEAERVAGGSGKGGRSSDRSGIEIRALQGERIAVRRTKTERVPIQANRQGIQNRYGGSDLRNSRWRLDKYGLADCLKIEGRMPDSADTGAIEMLYRRYGATLMLFAAAITGERSRAQDAVH
jgi:hypothetical protein